MEPVTTPPDAEEQAKHVSAIQSLSEKLDLPTATVAEVYERELASIRQGALITTYLPIFVTRRVSEMLGRLALSAKQRPGGRAAAGLGR
jgi:hypothetical protein